MTNEVKAGQRATLELEVQVIEAYPGAWNPHATVEFIDSDGDGNRITSVKISALTPIVEPAKVGDVLTDQVELERLPAGSVVVDKDGDAWQYGDRSMWRGAARDGDSGWLTRYQPITLVHLP